MNTHKAKLGLAWILSNGLGPQIALAPDDGRGGDDGEGDDVGGEDDASPKGLQRSGLFEKPDDGDGDNQGNDDAGDEGDDDPKVPAKFLDEDGKPKLAELAKAYSDLEAQHGKLRREKKVVDEDLPDDADGYFSEGLKLEGDEYDRMSDLPVDDPGLKAWANVCHENGIGPEKAAQIAKQYLATVNPNLPMPVDRDAEMQSLGKNGPAIIDGVYVWLDGEARKGTFSERSAELIAGLSGTADGIRLLAEMRKMAGEEPIPLIPSDGNAMNLDQWNAAYSKAINDGNYPEQQRLEKLKDKMFPDGA